MADISTIEPSSVTAGDTIAWTRSLSDYSAADGWVLSYRLINATAKIDISSSASGADHAVAVTAATSAVWTAGWYDWQAVVTLAAARHTVGTGRMQILPNLAAVSAAGFDNRSTARQIYDTLIAAYQSAATSRAFVQEYEIAGRRMKFSTRAEWITEIDYWRAQVVAEERAANINAGLGAGNKLLVRFR
jgi:hypothetical protein